MTQLSELPSLYDRLSQGPKDGSLPDYFHVPLQQYALSGVETDRILTDAEQELWRRGVLLGYILQKRSDQFFTDPFIQSFISPRLIAWLNESVQEKGNVPVTRFMALLHKHLTPYDRLYDLKKERSVKRFTRDLVLTVNMARGFPAAILPQIAFDGLQQDASGLPQPDYQDYPLSKGLAYIWRYLLTRVPFNPTHPLHRADFLLHFFRLFAVAHADPRLIPPTLIAYLNTPRFSTTVEGVNITNMMEIVFRLAGVQLDERFKDKNFATSMATQFFKEAYATLLLPDEVGAHHDAMALKLGIKVQRANLSALVDSQVEKNYIWKKPAALAVNLARGEVNVLACDDAAGQMEPLAQHLADMAKAGMVRAVYVPSMHEIAKAKTEGVRKSEDTPGPINLFACPLDRLGDFILRRGVEKFEGRYNIGYCSWGTDRLPQIYKVALNLLDEIWVPSEFQKKLFEKETRTPVRVIPAPVNMAEASPYMSREILDIPDDRFLFATSFDCFDWMSRKNPVAVVRAFQDAFKGNDKVVLAVKSRNMAKTVPLKEEGHLKRMHLLWENDPRIHVFHDDFTDAEMTAFLKMADAYVTLPRASSFDATLVEAMMHGKPVAAPAWGGIADYLSEQTGFIVKTVPCSVVFDAYHFLDKEVGHGWVDPEHDSAVAAFREIYENREEAQKRAQTGQKKVIAHYGMEACGARMKARIDEIMLELLGKKAA